MPGNQDQGGTRRQVCILSVGAYTPIGLTAITAASAARAGIAGFAAHPTAVDRAGEPINVARFPDLDDVLGAGRFRESASIAASEAVSPLTTLDREVAGNFYIGIGLPESRLGRPDGLDEEVAGAVESIVSGFAPLRTVKTFASGHAAGLLALKEGADVIRSGKSELALVGGVDSYQDIETLAWLESTEQINGAGPEGNPWGFIPGEGAAFVLLGSASTAERLGLSILGEVLSVGAAIEPNRIKTDDVCTGEGLTKAFRESLGPFRDRLDHPKANQIYCDMNGEPYRATEYAYAVSRHSGFLVDPGRFQAPADCWGDVGAASGPLALVLASQAAARGYAEGPYSLIWASSEAGERAAALIEMNIVKKGSA